MKRMDLIRPFLSTPVVLLFAVGSWFLLGPWLPRGSERVYLLIPPVFLCLIALYAPAGRQRLKPHLRNASAYVVVLAVCCTLYGSIMANALLPEAGRGFLRGVSFWEVLVAVYFLIAVKLLLTPIWSVGRNSIRSLHERIVGTPNGLDPLAPSRRPLLPRILPSFLLIPLFLPYTVAALFVHRFKVPNPASPREIMQREYEDVELVTADGLTLRGWFLPAREPSARTVLFCHGLGANRSNFLGFVQVADALGANVLLFDFRGHGDSDGHTVSLGYWEKLDVLAAADYLRTERPTQARELIGFGVSMGTCGLIRAAAEIDPPFDALLLDSSFASAVELTDNVLRLYPAIVRPFLAMPGVPLASLEAGCWLPDLRPIDRVHLLRAPVLFVHAEGDPMIPSDHSRRLYERAVEPKTLWIVDTDVHGGALFVATADYLRAARRLLEGSGQETKY